MQKSINISVCLQVILLLIAMLFGALIVKYKLPPYKIIRTSYLMFQSQMVTTENKQYRVSKVDVNKLISIKAPQDIYEKRKELISFLWGRSILPSFQPKTVEKYFSDERYKDIDFLNRIDRLIVEMEFGLESYIYHFIPRHPNNMVVLYHQGHRGDFYNSKEQIQKLIDKGYSVVAFSMPLLGLNNKPSFISPRFGKLQISSHDNMKFLTPRKGHQIKYFIEPVITTLNYLEDNFKYSSISMIGISGGGWTTTIAAAVDTRIVKSFPVAATYPVYLRSAYSEDWGDYEQSEPELYSITNYLELYILGAYGTNRKQLQVFNMYDPCCFAGTGWKTYLEVMLNRMHKLGKGEFEVFLDKSHQEHIVSPVTMSHILYEIPKD